MFNRLAKPANLLKRSGYRFLDFLKDINYFEEPKEFINVGLDNPPSPPNKVEKVNPEAKLGKPKVDEVIDLLSREVEVPELDYADAKLEGTQMADLAVTSGIYRDLLGNYEPDREHIKFTPQQADDLDKYITHEWITDQPFARVTRQQKKAEPLRYFLPLVGISARFVHQPELSQQDESGDSTFAHTAYYGNFIPAFEALNKPSICLDGKLLSPDLPSVKGEKEFDNWIPGALSLENFGTNSKYYSVILVNLDYLHEKSSHLHWMVANIRRSDGKVQYDEVCDYLPVHGIRGFGYSRYTFVVFQHDSPIDTKTNRIDGFELKSRKFDTSSFIDSHSKINMKPVGLSWFQTAWDESSNGIFHDYLKLKAPIFEYVQPKEDRRQDKAYPGKVPFNVYLDHHRDKKEINEQVLLERLKTVDPFDYKDQYVPPKVPPTVFVEKDIPSWMRIVMMKKKNRVGYWRGLRPASATLPLDNNADLDNPLRPIASSRIDPPEWPNQYRSRIKYKPLKTLPHGKPGVELPSVYVQEGYEVNTNELDRLLKQVKEVKKN